jgi:hypothetical protein
MNTLVMTAIADCVRKIVSKMPSLPVGRHHVDETVTIRVVGEVLKCEDELYTPTVHIPIKSVLAFLLPSLGATREAQQKKLLDACKAALAKDVQIEDTITLLLKNVDEAFKIVQNEVTSQLPKQTKDGKVIVKCKVEDIAVTMSQAASSLNPQQIEQRV